MKRLICMLFLIALCGCSSKTEDEKLREKALTFYKGKNYSQALYIYEELSKKNDPVAQFYLGMMYLKGWGIPKDKNKAKGYFEKAAEHNLATAQFNLYLMYEKGELGKVDIEKALFWLKKAAGNDDSDALNNLGMLLLKGENIKQNYKEALECFIKASDDSIDAQLSLGHMYYYGKGVKQNYATAFECYKKAADAGSNIGQFQCGIMCYYGRGIIRDYEQALKWFIMSGKNQNNLARCYVGIMLYKGLGYKKDIELSSKIFSKLFSQKKNAMEMDSIALAMAENDLKLDEALKITEDTIRREPENYKFMITLSYIYYKQKKYEIAIEKIQNVLKLKPSNLEALVLLGDIYEAFGDIDKAREQWKLALKNVGGDDNLAEKLKKYLDNISEKEKSSPIEEKHQIKGEDKD